MKRTVSLLVAVILAVAMVFMAAPAGANQQDRCEAVDLGYCFPGPGNSGHAKACHEFLGNSGDAGKCTAYQGVQPPPPENPPPPPPECDPNIENCEPDPTP
jgi:hypothetical protein